MTSEARHWKWNRVTSVTKQIVTWQKYHGRTNVTCKCWQICILHQQKVTSVMRVETPWSRPLWKITINISVTMTKVTEWWTATISRRTWKWMKKLFCHLLVLKILTATFSWSPVVLKFHTETSQTDTCQEYEWTCWTAATPTTNCR